jgi:hypothetical protein
MSVSDLSLQNFGFSNNFNYSQANKGFSLLLGLYTNPNILYSIIYITNLQCQMRTDCHTNRHKFSSFLLLLTFKVLIVNHPFISSSLVIMLQLS